MFKVMSDYICMSEYNNKKGGCVAESKRGYNYRSVLYCKCMLTVPENSGSGMSVDSSHCWDGIVDMSAVTIRKLMVKWNKDAHGTPTYVYVDLVCAEEDFFLRK